MTDEFIELHPQRILRKRHVTQDNSALRFPASGVMFRDEIIFATYQRQALNGTHRPPINDDTHRIKALHDVGIHPHFEDPDPKTLAIKLSENCTTFPGEVVAEITREGESKNPLVRAIVDQKLGAVHEPDHPLAIEDSSVVTITTLYPERVVEHLSALPFVREVFVPA